MESGPHLPCKIESSASGVRRCGRALAALFCGVVLVSSAGCWSDSGTNQAIAPGGGSGAGGDAGGGTTLPGVVPTPGPTPPGATPSPTSIVPTWYGVQANILQQYCTLCHSGAGAPKGLSWEVAQYDAIV